LSDEPGYLLTVNTATALVFVVEEFVVEELKLWGFCCGCADPGYW
jgi:hypothetical protein